MHFGISTWNQIGRNEPAPYPSLMFANFDASKPATMTKDGSNKVSQWRDVNGGGYDLNQFTVGQNPTYIADDGDGLPALSFAGTCCLRNVMTTSQNEDTFFLVMKIGTVGGNGGNFWGRGNGPGYTAAGPVMDWQAAGSSNGQTAIRGADVPVIPKYIILSGRRSANANAYYGGSGNTGVMEIRQNGAPIVTTTHTGVAASGTMFMGSSGAGGFTGALDRVREGIWYKGYLTDEQMLAVEDYLNAKWNVYSDVAVRRGVSRGVQYWMTATGNSAPNAEYPLTLIMGQSGAGGEAIVSSVTALPAVIQGAIPGAIIYNPLTPAFETLQVGVNNQPNSAATPPAQKHGIELSLGYDLATDLGVCYLIKCFQGGTALQDRWLPSLAKGSNLWRSSMDGIDAAIYAIGKASGIELKVATTVWYQGEADAAAGGTFISNYAANEQVLVAATRAKTHSAAVHRFISVKVRNVTEPDANYDAVTAAKVANASVIPNYQVIEGWTAPSSVGGPHGDSASMITIGNVVAGILGATTVVS